MRLSVICPVLDTGAALLLAAAHSVLSQGPAGIAELILVDDGSTAPETIAALAQLCEQDARVRLLRTAGRVGPADARNAGIAVASGDWIGFLDSDDLWCPGAVARLQDVLARAPQAGWLCGRYSILDAWEGVIAKPPLTNSCAPLRNLPPDAAVLGGGELTRMLILREWVPLGTCVIRATTLRQAGGLPQGLMYGEDLIVLMVLSTTTEMVYVDAEIYQYRRGHGSLMTSPGRLSRQAFRWHEVAASEPRLRGFRRELRWIRFRDAKQLALNNLLQGRRARALFWALRAFATDPRTVSDLLLFLGLFGRSRAEAERLGERYSATRRLRVAPVAADAG